MKITFERRPGRPLTGYLLVRFLPQDQRAKLTPPVSEAEFSGKANSTLYLRDQNTLCVGLGERAAIDARIVRQAAGVAGMFAKRMARARIAVDLENWPQFAGSVAEGILLADYRFEQFKPRKSPKIEALQLHIPAEEVQKVRREGERGRILAECTNMCREIGNQPGNLLYPEVLARRAQKLGAETGLKVTVFDEKRLQAEGFGGILCVGRGSARGPRFMMLEHRKGSKGKKPLVLIGKAVTFDSGGISIKPAANMEEMIFDKCGGMAVLGAMAAIAALGLKRNIVGLLASAENMPSGTAFRPGDIVTMYDGKHIEIVNTDAEGRMVLGDAIAYARQTLGASAIVDLATLTGACGVALGEYAAGLWASDDDLGAAVVGASERAGERLWRMPMYPEYDDQIKSDVALLKNSGGRLGGACTGAAFLKAFAEDTPWAHLDIAYTAHREKDQAFMARGATGFGVRTLVELAERWTG